MNDKPFQSRSILLIPHFRFLSFIGGGTFVAWTAWLAVINKLDPYNSPQLALPLFFLTLLIALTGSFTLVLFLIKRWKTRDQIYLKHITLSLRQGFLLSLCTCFCLGLLMLGLLRIWNGLLLVTLMMLVEFYLSAKED